MVLGFDDIEFDTSFRWRDVSFVFGFNGTDVMILWVDIVEASVEYCLWFFTWSLGCLALDIY